MVILLLICALVFPIIFLLNLSPSIQIMIVAVAFAFCTLGIGGIIFVPKLIILVPGHDIEGLGGGVKENGKKRAKNGNAASTTVAVASGVGGTGTASATGSTKASHGIGRETSGDLLLASVDLKGRSFAEKVQLCRSQVAQWAALLARIEQGFTSDSGSGSSRGVSSSVYEPSVYRPMEPSASLVAIDMESRRNMNINGTESVSERSQLNAALRVSVSRKGGNSTVGGASTSAKVIPDHRSSIPGTPAELRLEKQSSLCWQEPNNDILVRDLAVAAATLDRESLHDSVTHATSI